MRPSESAAVSLVCAAVTGKYDGYPVERLRAVCEQEWRGLKQRSSAELSGVLSPIDRVQTDIRNQLSTLMLMSDSHLEISEPIQTIHRWLLGSTEASTLRTSNHLADFSDDLRVDYRQVAWRLNELERLICEVSASMEAAGSAAQTVFTAFIFASISRIHPFSDGNGRVARMLVQQHRLWWGQPLLLIPKVRNSDTWKRAIVGAVDGNSHDLVSCLTAAEELF